MNKRQRKKQITKAKRVIERGIRDALKHKIGEPLTPTQLHEIGNVIGDYIKAGMMRSSFVSQVIEPSPKFVAPFHKWRELGKDALTHHVGAYPYVDGHGQLLWRRFCDYESVDSMYILSHDEAVTCFGCISRERFVYAPTDL